MAGSNDRETPASPREKAPRRTVEHADSNNREPPRSPSERAPRRTVEYNQTIAAAIRRSTARDRFGNVPELPSLDYNILHHKKKLFIISGLLIFEGSLLPIALFYPLWYATSLSHGILFAIITSFFGIISGLEFTHRSWRLVHKNDKYRPLDGSRWKFDFTHATLSFSYTILTGILIGASIPYEPLVRPLAMPIPVFFIGIGILCCVTGVMSALRMRTLCKVSSIPKGAPQPPYVLTAIEDVVGVDGGGARPYRAKLLERYKASKRFRRLIAGLNWFWGLGLLMDGTILTVLVWAIPSEEIAYGVAWGEPFVFLLVWTPITVLWCSKAVKSEKEHWIADFREDAIVKEAGSENASAAASV
ncbi:hypothetical protein F5Y16DRAFT_359989 [Xylariaceae sp. FL0255]|nr:hypothetical protein F5Y16DRAFT_359989 [Xylariaceae sp. FL0255]